MKYSFYIMLLFSTFSFLSCEKEEDIVSIPNSFVGKTFCMNKKEIDIKDMKSEDYLQEYTYTYSISILSSTNIVKRVVYDYGYKTITETNDTIIQTNNNSDDPMIFIEKRQADIKYHKGDNKLSVKYWNGTFTLEFLDEHKVKVVDAGKNGIWSGIDETLYGSFYISDL